jgi:hypothetical protein
MNFLPALRIFNQDSKAWSDKHGLEPIEVECNCGRKKVTNIPMVSKDGTPGLIAAKCKCGSEADTYCVLWKEEEKL